MRVLLLHNRYRAEGGEERAVRDILDLLTRRGHDVELLERGSDQAGRIRAGRSLLRGGEDPDEVARAVRRLRAEVVHAHNVHPLFGWRSLAAAKAAGAATVLQLHNFRLFCAIGVSYRDGAPCHRCTAGNTLPGLRLNCRGSLPEAIVYAAGLRAQQPRLLSDPDRLVVLSDAHGTRLHELGLVRERTDTLPNFIPSARVAERTAADAQTYALVSGRLVEEKGFDTAIAAARSAGVPLIVAGEGPDERRLRALADSAEIRFTGWLTSDALDRLRAQAAAVLVPSRCEEACPYALLDALGAGIPVLVSDRGGLPEMVSSESVLPADDEPAWAQALSALWKQPERRAALGERALETARRRFGEERYHERLLAVYESASARA